MGKTFKHDKDHNCDGCGKSLKLNDDRRKKAGIKGKTRTKALNKI